ncbi:MULTISPECIES: DUF3081 domain-containing protein [Alteromonas]|jgi:hypothetical protein|uniref:DUF3081 family protein n=1 Tax=Alteromonas genovensis TaxID=471225 RepID=A0A6N9TAR5_9ALTE|nr:MULTISPECIES: DUF3081 domain-containing protein [Alteromonas]MAI36441.1 DUF3081 domain-containing protein [Alteromonas sp.]NDW14270.1 DUF3081 family protein [Alteromonas genovensis]OUX91180.1 MAG: hypothetical protein CBB95_02660 [Alteromonas sp. TMED35]|tara:strand:- start:3319 stop:3576 length:258 start_codon:yes stop_codon:yes gene_type:complete
MKNELDSKFLLQVFDKIRQHGSKEGDEYKLMGITAFTDHDGYTLYIEDVNVKLRFGFHNQYHFDYDSSDHYDSFEKKLKQIDKTY